MINKKALWEPGQRISHPEFGEGVLIEIPRNGYVRVFFSVGERQVPLSSIQPALSYTERLLNNIAGTQERLRNAWLYYEAHALPLMESAAALTAAKIDLLPHQVVLTHSVATASPRRFLIADEVGLGKTIETALILRELASRGELRRALIIVPAGLVNNWHHELNEVFHLNFEIFGSEGDVTDRKSNAFAKHDRLIASIDTLKRRERVHRLLQAPPWDLVVFDEAHHITAYRSGSKVRKTENFKLAEAIKDHMRDMIFLSATPHQGDHFRFWMLIQLLNPLLFHDPEDMLENRHRLNVVVYRRTKADACRPDGSPLFARRWVHTESFTMTEEERRFYRDLAEYLEEGFALAKRQGNKGRALGFVMTIFQKIAASSFVAVRRTLRRRLLMLTIHEAILKEEELDLDGRQQRMEEARNLIREEYDMGDDAVSRGEVDRILAEIKVRLLKKISEEDIEIASKATQGELSAMDGEDIAANTVNLVLPEERLHIQNLLSRFPQGKETKVEKLLRGLGALWRQNAQEKVVIFATYLGTVDLLGQEIERTYPDQGVVVLRGGDHGAKLAAERRFKKPEGPKVLVCTAAGREGINLQYSHILFNFDLPWNPMDIEQRIGRIHRYGQHHTAQIYNLVLSDTIEGRIFLLLNDKLLEIARTLGKVDEAGNVAEDFRIQILGQLSERLSYDNLYRDALADPELRRTQLELEAALANATEARQVVFSLFQDLNGFNLDEYKPFANISAGVDRIVSFLKKAIADQKLQMERVDNQVYSIIKNEEETILKFTTDRELGRKRADIDLMGIDHPFMMNQLKRWQQLPPEQVGISLSIKEYCSSVLTFWTIETQGKNGELKTFVKSIAIDAEGKRLISLERNGIQTLNNPPTKPSWNIEERKRLLHDYLEPMLQRELQHHGLVVENGGYSAKLIGWIEIVP